MASQEDAGIPGSRLGDQKRKPGRVKSAHDRGKKSRVFFSAKGNVLVDVSQHIGQGQQLLVENTIVSQSLFFHLSDLFLKQ